MDEKLKTIKRWRDEYRRIEKDTSHGTGIRPHHVESKIKADTLDMVVRLFDCVGLDG